MNKNLFYNRFWEYRLDHGFTVNKFLCFCMCSIRSRTDILKTISLVHLLHKKKEGEPWCGGKVVPR